MVRSVEELERGYRVVGEVRAGRRSMKGMTEVQSRVFVRWYEVLRDEGRMMTYREVCSEQGWSGTNTLTGVLDSLERKGWVRRRGGYSGITFLKRPDGSEFRGFADKGELE